MKKLCKGAKLLALALFLAVGMIFAVGTSTKAATPKVTGVKQIEAEQKSVKVSWDAVFGLKGYLYSRVSPNPQMDVYQDSWVGSSGQTSYKISGLNEGKTYYVQIGTASSASNYSDAPADTVWSDVVEVVTAPARVVNDSIKFDSATETSITVSWGAVEGATSYRVLAYDDKEVNGISIISNGTSATVTGLKNNTKYNVEIFSQKSNSSNTYTAEIERYNYGIIYNVPTMPTKVTGVDCTYFDMSVKNGNATFSWDQNTVADGYEYEIYKYNGKKALTKGSVTKYYYSSTSVKNSKLKTRQIYKIRVRAYVNKSNNQKIYGAWSSDEYFCRMAGTDVSLKKSGNNKIKASWKKVTGATNYTVYLGTNSTYSSNVKYKKVGTTKKTSYDIKTKIKKNKYYYVRVVPNYKKGKTTYAGTVNGASYYSAYGHINGNKWCVH